MDFYEREYSWLLKRLESVKAALIEAPFNRYHIAEKVALTKEIKLRTCLLVAVCDGEETEVGRWRGVEHCARSAQHNGIALGTEYPVEGTGMVVTFIAKPSSEETDNVGKLWAKPSGEESVKVVPFIAKPIG